MANRILPINLKPGDLAKSMARRFPKRLVGRERYEKDRGTAVSVVGKTGHYGNTGAQQDCSLPSSSSGRCPALRVAALVQKLLLEFEYLCRITLDHIMQAALLKGKTAFDGLTTFETVLKCADRRSGLNS